MPGNAILHDTNERNRNTRKVRGLFNHLVSRNKERGQRHPEERANASEMAQAAIHRYDERHGLTRRALPAMKYQPVGKFKLDRAGEKELAARVKAHRVAELMRKREENVRLAPQRQLAQKAAKQAHKKTNKDVDDLADMFGKNLGFKGGRHTRRHRRHRRRSTRA